MFGQVLTIARNTFVESIRQPVFFVLVLAGGLLQVVNTALSAFSMGMTEQTEVFGDDKLLLDMGLATVMVCATLLAAFIATSVLSREIENKTALTVISKPVGRPVFIIGKYLGVTGAILVATVILSVFFMFAIRHRVMSTARDTLDGPVLLFSILSVLIPVALAVWGNFFYGWVFSSTAIGAMLPATLIAFVLTLAISKEWAIQPLSKDFKPQITIAVACAGAAILVLTAAAVAASTRLGQVMTLVVCCGLFVLGLLSNHLLGRFAFTNPVIGVIKQVEIDPQADFRQPGATATITLDQPAREPITVGASLFFGPNPSGVGLLVPAHRPFEGDPTSEAQVIRRGTPPALAVRTVTKTGESEAYTLVNVGGIRVGRAPRAGDFIFTGPTRSNWLARGAWSLVPNLQTFWLVDAITQGHTIPARYLGLVLAYAGVQITAFLALAVLLFQRRDVG
ncbi:MAG TPA: hypothetical protein DEB06_02450 [Phycisphaerales bacterium]|nr:hypothetical protein [Phycisphaerales bacterium]